MDTAHRCDLLYKSFVDLVQKRQACRLITAALGWDEGVAVLMQKLERRVNNASGGKRDRAAMGCAEEDVTNALGHVLTTLPVWVCEGIAREFLRCTGVDPLLVSLPLWWCLLRWLMVGVCLSDPLAHCFWLALQAESGGSCSNNDYIGIDNNDDNNNNGTGQKVNNDSGALSRDP
ncbi:hypothetical protein DQ04_02171050 [Trypanosoma grayi]|uniref:hypothetical protein n=1 Tax=Trypanosoma grayi TaxID=71804 RepID=UPI0004F453D0|nr:hypothetical protein DQ04_02171050 [Trypanosoma grayi]KEG11898.1 hypothetical protein DQ04_02171050 [Trypanosoma grayi]